MRREKPGFSCRHGLRLILAALPLIEFADLGSRIAVDQFVLHCCAQNCAKSRKDQPYRIAGVIAFF